MLEAIKSPWPWYVAGPLIGLMVPALLLLGNRSFGISSTMRHICAACFPSKIEFFRYNWRREIWNLVFAGGIVIGAIIATWILDDPSPVAVDPRLAAELHKYGINDFSDQLPSEIFSFRSLFTLRGVILLAGGGFLVGFGTRYAGGCTSGHAIMGLSTLQLPSLIATISFMAGGILAAHFLLPFIMHL